MGVAHYLSTGEILGRGEVGRIGVGEGSSYEVGHLDCDVEGGVGWDAFSSCRRIDDS